MKQRTREYLIIPAALSFVVILLCIAWMSQSVEQVAPPLRAPDFAAMTDVAEKKAAFFEYLLPKVRSANDRVLTEKLQLTDLLTQMESDSKLSESDEERLQELRVRYRVSGDPLADAEVQVELKKRVDLIPASLVLAQAANESAWGTARFARYGNNFFGLWCWVKNCGMVPTDREPDRKHEVASFDTVDAGIDYYLLTLNSHPAYQKLRAIRAQARELNTDATGFELALGLDRYSERGEAYVAEIRAMIRFNELQRFNRDQEVGGTR